MIRMCAQKYTYERWVFAFDIRADDTVPAAIVARRLLKHIGRAWGIHCRGYSEDAELMELRQQIKKLRMIIDGLAARVAAQSELPTAHAEKRETSCTITTPTTGGLP